MNRNNKTCFINLLQLCIEDDDIDCDIEDQTGKLDLHLFTFQTPIFTQGCK